MDDARRCVAQRTDGSGRCEKAAILGGTVCHKHGGNAPQIRRKAQERLAAMVDPALDALQRALRANDMKAVVAAARAVLDRAGFPATSRMEHEQIAQAERQITEDQARSIARVVRATLTLLGLYGDHPAVQQAFRAALEAEREGKPPPTRLEGITPIPEPVMRVLDRWWEGERPPIALIEASVEEADE